MARGGAVLGETMTSTLTPWLTGVHSTFLSDVRFQQLNNPFHKGAFLEYSPQPWSFACDTFDAASRDSFAPVIMSLLIYVLEDHFHFLTLLV